MVIWKVQLLGLGIVPLLVVVVQWGVVGPLRMCQLKKQKQKVAMAVTCFGALTAHDHELKLGIALTEVTYLLKELLVILLLVNAQIGCVALHALSHVIWQVLESKPSLFFSGSKVGSGIGREYFEAWISEWRKSEKRAF